MPDVEEIREKEGDAAPPPEAPRPRESSVRKIRPALEALAPVLELVRAD